METSVLREENINPKEFVTIKNLNWENSFGANDFLNGEEVSNASTTCLLGQSSHIMPTEQVHSFLLEGVSHSKRNHELVQKFEKVTYPKSKS